MKTLALLALTFGLAAPAHAHSFLSCHDQAHEWAVVDNGRGLLIEHHRLAVAGAKLCDERQAVEETVDERGCEWGEARAILLHKRKFEAALDLGPGTSKVALTCLEITRSDISCGGTGGGGEELY